MAISNTRLFSSKGCYYRYTTGDSDVYYSLKPELSSEQSDVPILLQGVPRRLGDINAPVSCLNNIKVFYTFGQSFGAISIKGIVLLGPSGDMNSGEKIIEDYFQKNRSSVRSEPLQLSRSVGGDPATPFFLINMRIDKANTQLHILPFEFEGIVIEPKKGDGDG